MKIMKFEISKAALINAGVALGMFTLAMIIPDIAHAQSATGNAITNYSSTQTSKGVKGLVNETVGNLSDILPAFSAAAYLGGTIFAISTLLDAKKYSEDPGQFKGGIPKIVVKGAVAAGLFSLPSLTATVADSFFNSEGNVIYQPLNQNLTNGVEQ